MDNLEPITRNEMFLNGDDLEPITREEMILAGADLEPITRHEWFLKKYRGGGGGGGYDLVNVPNLPADIASFTDGTDLPMASLKVAVTPYQDLSHGDPSPENIRPISGWSAVDVTNMDDISDKAFFDGLLNGTYGYVDLGSYTYTAVSMSNDRTAYCISIYDLPMNPKYDISSVPDAVCSKFLPTYQTASSWMAGEFVFTGSAGTLPQNSLGFITKTSDYADATAFKTAMSGVHLIYKLTTPTTPTITPTEFSNLLAEFGINGTTITIQLGDTYYGGKLDVVSGVLTVDRVSLTVDENSNIIPGSGSFPFRIDLLTGAKASSSASALTGVKCNFLKEVTQSSSWGVDGTFSRVTTDAKIVYFKVNSEITTTQQLKTFLQSNNLQFVYELATPITVQLSPTQVKSLEGENNISADCGQITEVKYFKKA